jgi:hypothetical protein
MDADCVVHCRQCLIAMQRCEHPAGLARWIGTGLGSAANMIWCAGCGALAAVKGDLRMLPVGTPVRLRATATAEGDQITEPIRLDWMPPMRDVTDWTGCINAADALADTAASERKTIMGFAEASSKPVEGAFRPRRVSLDAAPVEAPGGGESPDTRILEGQREAEALLSKVLTLQAEIVNRLQPCHDGEHADVHVIGTSATGALIQCGRCRLIGRFDRLNHQRKWAIPL